MTGCTGTMTVENARSYDMNEFVKVKHDDFTEKTTVEYKGFESFQRSYADFIFVNAEYKKTGDNEYVIFYTFKNRDLVIPNYIAYNLDGKMYKIDVEKYGTLEFRYEKVINKGTATVNKKFIKAMSEARVKKVRLYTADGFVNEQSEEVEAHSILRRRIFERLLNTEIK